MSRDAVTYQLEDVTAVTSWLADATLAATLAARTAGWRGFAKSTEELDTSNPAAAEVDGFAADPVATAGWRIGYGTDLSDRQALDGDLLSGLPGILYITIAVQPHARLAVPYQLAEDIRTSIAAQARAAGVHPNVSIPIAQGRDMNGWSTWSLLLRLWT